MKVALCQLSSAPEAEVNLRALEAHVRACSGEGVELVVFPEATMVPFGSDLPAAAEQHYARWSRRLVEVAAAHRVTIVVGIFKPADGERVANVLAVASPDGGFVEYEKLHLYDAHGYRESDGVRAGNLPGLATVEGETVGLAICYDIRFPELFIQHASEGARLSIISASWAPGEGKTEQWRLLARARAIDTASWIIATDQAVTPTRAEHPSGVGFSMVVRPDGLVEAQLGETEGVLIADLDLGLADEVRAKLPLGENRRFTLGLA